MQNEYYREKLFCWLALIHFKSLYKDLFITRFDHESGKNFILGEERNWFIHHHINSVCRLDYPEISLNTKAVGSMFFFELREDGSEPFDFITMHEFSTLMLRVGNKVIIAVFDDSCGTSSIFNDSMGQYLPQRPLDILDIKEIFGHITLINNYLDERPQYFTKFEIHKSQAIIDVRLPAKGAMCIFDPNNSEHLEIRREIWWILFRSLEKQMTKEEKPYLEDGSLSYLQRDILTKT